MHTLVRYLQICDGDLSQGSMRCDANVSVRPVGQEEYGERTEIKNINSFRFVERAIVYEIQRHIDVLESGGTIERETRQYDADRDETRAMRGKELSADYRYFPDPDLLPLQFSQAFVDKIAADMPELPIARRERYQSELGLAANDAAWISRDPEVAEYFDAVCAVCGNAKQSANWIMGELSAHLNKDDVDISASPVGADQLGALIQRLDDNTLSSKTAKTLFEALWSDGGEVDALIESLGLKQMSDSGELETIVDQVMADNPAQLEQLRNGKDKLMGFFVGQVMKLTQGKANPQQVNEIIRSRL
jgi:aspartyl-tRNA(Asn)/glutamyl-tRNA(Gln) amidotransferase subunit B